MTTEEYTNPDTPAYQRGLVKSHENRSVPRARCHCGHIDAAHWSHDGPCMNLDDIHHADGTITDYECPCTAFIEEKKIEVAPATT